MARHPARHEVLLGGGQVGHRFGGGGGGGPGPGREFVDEVVARLQEFVRGDLAVGAEGGGVVDGGPFVAEDGEVGAEGLHGGRRCLGWSDW